MNKYAFIIDDDQNRQQMLHNFLERGVHEVDTASDRLFAQEKFNQRQEVRRLQREQLEYGVYACIPGTQHTYEEVIQMLIGLDLRRQYEERRQRKYAS